MTENWPPPDPRSTYMEDCGDGWHYYVMVYVEDIPDVGPYHVSIRAFTLEHAFEVLGRAKRG